MEDRDLPEEKALIERLRARFPDDAVAVDEGLVRRWGHDVEWPTPHAWLEAFADHTTLAVIARDQEKVARHTAYLAQYHAEGPDAVQRMIDVAYAEPLLANAGPRDKRWAWPFIAAPIRTLHAALWGAPPA